MTYQPTATGSGAFPFGQLFGGKPFTAWPGGYSCETGWPLRLLILGNSFTFHPLRAEVGWTEHNGMAATAPEFDYVHQLAGMVAGSMNRAVAVQHAAIWSWEGGYANVTEADLPGMGFAEYRDWEPDFFILRLGENINNADVNLPMLPAAMHTLTDYIVNGRVIPVMYTDSWSGQNVIAQEVEAAAARGYPLARISNLARDPLNFRLDHPNVGVAGHPSNLGHRRIAERIFDTGLAGGIW